MVLDRTSYIRDSNPLLRWFRAMVGTVLHACLAGTFCELSRGRTRNSEAISQLSVSVLTRTLVLFHLCLAATVLRIASFNGARNRPIFGCNDGTVIVLSV